ncbi:MAG: hypothetical protein IJA31_03660 [Clostridia bacterium]|nr:hypothetical protein [Clostridia bacterium]MBQ6863689.1 hypothetical protein [Clostridia bacterium]
MAHAPSKESSKTDSGMKYSSKALLIMLTALVLCLAAVFLYGHFDTLRTTEEILKKAEKECHIPIADDSSLSLCGSCEIGENEHMFWFTAVDNQGENRYQPMRFTEVGENKYKFRHAPQLFVCENDIAYDHYSHGIVYLVNNPDCVSIVFNDGTSDEITVQVDNIPFIYKYEYKNLYNDEGTEEIITVKFLDSNGDIIM